MTVLSLLATVGVSVVVSAGVWKALDYFREDELTQDLKMYKSRLRQRNRAYYRALLERELMQAERDWDDWTPFERQLFRSRLANDAQAFREWFEDNHEESPWPMDEDILDAACDVDAYLENDQRVGGPR